jgi:hypothetical protein
VTDENEQSIPSRVSHGEPVAWAVERGAAYPALCHTHCDALHVAAQNHGSGVAPLYRQPQPTLTAEEREAVAWAIVAADLEKTETVGEFSAFVAKRAATLRGLLERTK